MSTPLQEKIDALEAELREYESLPLAERAQWKEVITAKTQVLHDLLNAQTAPRASGMCFMKVRGCINIPRLMPFSDFLKVGQAPSSAISGTQ